MALGAEINSEELQLKREILKIWGREGADKAEKYCLKLYYKKQNKTIDFKRLVLKKLILIETELNHFESALMWADSLIESLKKEGDNVNLKEIEAMRKSVIEEQKEYHALHKISQ